MKGHQLARLDYFALGGTIASVRGRSSAAVPALTATELVAATPELSRLADIQAHEFSLVPSAQIVIPDVMRLRDQIELAVNEGSRGIVITQGTDTIEETAFLLDLLWDGEAPIVLSGAMRNPSVQGSEGGANLLASVQVAASEIGRGLGVLVCLNDEIHSARYVRKTHTSNPAAFQSPGLGPIGWVAEGRPMIPLRPSGRRSLVVPTGGTIPQVALLRLGLGDDGRLLSALVNLGYQGVVIEGLGGGHVPPAVIPYLERLPAEMPVVLSSRTGAGEVLVDTYGFQGSEIELIEMGLIRSGALDGLKARLLLTLGLAAGLGRVEMANLFRAVGTTAGPVIHEQL